MSLFGFVGATGGCTNAALVLALNNDYECTARKLARSINAAALVQSLTVNLVARTPQKLVDMLLAKGVPQATIDSKLHIAEGNIRDTAAVRAMLVHDGRPVSMIISGIGPHPTQNFDKTLCQDAARIILDVLDTLALPAAQRPFFVAVSSTGISSGPRDVPLLFTALYHVLLAIPHRDKRVMEDLILEADREGNKISGFCIVRPSLLIDWSSKGTVRVGSEEAPAVGYTIARDDVGKWIFEQCIQGDPKRWSGKKPSLTY